MMAWMVLLLNMGIVLVMTIQVVFYFNSVFGKERSNRAKPWMIGLFLLLDAMYFTIPLPEYLSSLLALFIIFILSLGYKVDYRLRLLFTFLYTVMFTLISLFCLYLLIPDNLLVESDPITTHVRNSFATLEEGQLWLGTSTLLSCLIMFEVIHIIRFVTKRQRIKLNLLSGLLFFSVPLISVYMVNVMVLYSEKNIHYFLAIFGLIILNVLVVYVLDTITSKLKLQHAHALLQQQMDYQDANYERTVHSFKNVKRLVHDTNQHFLYIAECIKQGKLTEASEHMSQTMHQLHEAYPRVNSGHLVVDALVSNMLNIGKANGIRMDTDLRLNDAPLAIERYDLCVVLGNMLDNALEASKQIRVAEDRYIRLRIHVSKQALLIHVLNHVDRMVGELHTHKKEAENHGFGLTNIAHICEKYGGHMTINRTQAPLVFENMVVLPFQETDRRT